MQAQPDLAVVAELIMNELIPVVGGLQQGAFLPRQRGGDPAAAHRRGTGCTPGPISTAAVAQPGLLGQSLIGQVAKTRAADHPGRTAGYTWISSAIG